MYNVLLRRFFWGLMSITALMAPLDALASDWQSTWDNTWGYTMMSGNERQQFEEVIRNLKTLKDCEAVLKRHNIVIQQRIDDWIVTPKRPNPVDTCGQLKAEGRITE